MSGAWAREPTFAPGDRIKVSNRDVLGHCRSPAYLRGKVGDVLSVHGAFRDPEKLAYHTPGLPPQVLYKVRFRQTEIWPDYTGPDTDMLEADIYEHWVMPA